MKTIFSKVLVPLTVLCTLLAASSVFANEYDLVIQNGRVMDPETKLDAVLNVGIRDGKIAKITKRNLSGRETLDAKGLVVAPGFIDFHSHGQDPFGVRLALRDGVTSPLELEVGAYPVDEYYNGREGKSQANYGASVGHLPSRLGIMDGLDNPGGLILYSDAIGRSMSDGMKWMTARSAPGSEKRAAIKAAVEEGLKQGGIGIGFPLGYYTAVSHEEVTEVASLANTYNSFLLTHVRYLSALPPSSYLGIEEMIAVASVNDVPLIVQHVPSNCIILTGPCLDLINKARERGMKIAAEFYPYLGGSSIIGADYMSPGWTERMGADYSDVTMVKTGEKLTEETYKKYHEEDPSAPMILMHIKEPDMLKAFADPYAFVGSDAFPYIDEKGQSLPWEGPFENAQGHPRGAGAHAKVLRLARENKLISLMDAVAKLSYYQADFIDEMVPDMRLRGRIQEGMIADITIFDPETVTDNADFEAGKNALPSTGIPYVVVNGTLVVEDSKVLPDVYPGKAIRNSVVK